MTRASSDHARRDQPAGVGSIAFLIIYAVLLGVLTTALWVTYFAS